MNYKPEKLREHAIGLGAVGSPATADAFRAHADALDECERMRKALLICREEFCWHGNTGKSLSADAYGRLVDMIDAAIDAQRPK